MNREPGDGLCKSICRYSYMYISPRETSTPWQKGFVLLLWRERSNNISARSAEVDPWSMQLRFWHHKFPPGGSQGPHACSCLNHNVALVIKRANPDICQCLHDVEHDVESLTGLYLFSACQYKLQAKYTSNREWFTSTMLGLQADRYALIVLAL